MGSMTLADIRKKYPQTNGLSDEDVISVIAQRYGASIEDTKTVLNYEPPEMRSRTWGEVAGDTLVAGAKSAVGLPQSILGLIDIPAGGRIGKSLEAAGYRPNEAQDMLSDMYSDPQKAANKNVADAKGFTDTAIAYVENPSAIATTIGESTGQMLGGGGMARKLVDMFPKLAPWAAGALGEGLMGAGSAESQLRAESEDGLTTAKQGLSALASGAGTAAFGALGGKIANSKLGQKVGIADIDTMLAGGGTAPKSTVGFLKSALASGVSESTLEEMPQSAWEQMMQNYAQEKPILDGVGKAMASGMVAGFAMGGAGGGYNAMVSKDQPEKIEPPQNIMDQTDIDSVINAAENSINQEPIQQRESTPIDDPMRLEVINQLPDSVRDTAIRAYNLIIDDATPKGLKKFNQRLLDDILEQAASEMQANAAPIVEPTIEQPKELEPFEQIKQLQTKVSDLEANNPFEQDHMDSITELQAAVTNYTAKTLESGEMPVFTSGELTIVVTPSAKQEGMFQVTRYSKNGAIGDSEYSSIEKAVESEGLQYNTPLSGKEAVAAITQANEAEGNFQSRLAEQKQVESNRVLADIETTDNRVAFEQEKSRVNQRNAIIDSILSSDAAVGMRPAQIADMVKVSMAEQGYANPVLNDSEFARIKRFNDIAKAEPVAETIDETNLEGQAPSSNLSELVPERKIDSSKSNVIATALPADLISVAQESQTNKDFWKALTARKVPLGAERNALMAAYKELKKNIEAAPSNPTVTNETEIAKTVAPESKQEVTPQSKQFSDTLKKSIDSEVGSMWQVVESKRLPETSPAYGNYMAKQEHAEAAAVVAQSVVESGDLSLFEAKAPESNRTFASLYPSTYAKLQQHVESAQPTTEIPNSASNITPTAIPSTATSVTPTEITKSEIPNSASSVTATEIPNSASTISTTAIPKTEIASSATSIAPTAIPSSASSVAPTATPNTTATPETTLRDNGTLNIKGETKALQTQLKEAGIPSIPSNGGVTVGAKNVEKAQAFIASIAPKETTLPSDTKVNNEETKIYSTMGGSTLSIDLGKPVWMATQDEVKEAVDAKGFNSKGNDWSNAHLEAVQQAFNEGKQLPEQVLYENRWVMRPESMTDTQHDIAVDVMVDTFRKTNDYAKATDAYKQYVSDNVAAPIESTVAPVAGVANTDQATENSGIKLSNPSQPTVQKVIDSALESDSPQIETEGNASASYTLPEKKVEADWKQTGATEVHPNYKPNDRQKILIDAVAAELDAGVFYNSELVEKVSKRLNVSNDVLESNRAGVQGGDFGYDVYHARKYVESQKENNVSKSIAGELSLNVGDSVGTLVTNDGKRTTNVKIESISDSGLIVTFTGNRGKYTVTGQIGVDSIKHSINRAKERNHRKDNYDEFISTKSKKVANSDTSKGNDSAIDKVDNQSDKDQLAGQADIFSINPNEAAKEQIQSSDLTPAEKLANIAAINRGDVSPDDVAKALGTLKNDRNTISFEAGNGKGDVETLTFSRGDYVNAGRNVSGSPIVSGEIEGISQAKREVKVGGQWFDFGQITHAEKPEQVPVKKEALSSVVDSVNKKNGEDLNESDAVINTNIMTIEDHQNVMKLARAGKIKVQDIKSAYFSLKENEERIKQGLSAKKKDDLLKAGGYNFAANHKSDNKDQIVRSLFSDMMDDFAYFSSDSLSYGFGAGQRVKAIDDRIAGLTQESLDKYAEKQKKKDEEAKAWMDERLEKMKAQEAGAKNPVTLADFQTNLRAKMAEGKTFAEARMMLTQEQRAQFDNLAAESTRAERAKNKVVAQEQTMRAPGEALTAGETIKTKHTKHGHDLWQFNLDQRVSKEEYQQLSNQARKLGGDYSSYRGNGAIPGWQFRTPESAQAFKDLIAGDNSAAKDVMAARRDAFADDRSQSASERLNEMAGALESESEDQLNRDRKTNTTRRAGMASRAEANARAGIAFANTMRNIANFIDNGKAKFLDKVREKKQVSLLTSAVEVAQYDQQKAQGLSYAEMEKQKGMPANQETADFAAFPSYTAYRSDLANLARQLLEVEGTKLFGKKLLDLADDTSDVYLAFAKANLNKVMTFAKKDGGIAAFTSKAATENAITRSGYRGQAIAFMVKRGEYVIIQSPSAAIKNGVWSGDGDKRITLSRDFGTELVEKIGRAARRGSKVSVPWQFESTYDKFKTLSRMNIETASEYRAALREFISLREQPKEANKVKELERSMIGRQNDGMDFFPTPIATADEMVQVAEIKPGMKVLEPSAGWGHIAERIREAGVEPDVVELSGKRRELLEAKGFNLVGSDFLEVTKGEGYDRILMNPPFSDRRDADHVQHAYSLLKPGGRLVAIMGEGVFFGKDKSAQAFRDWVESVGGTDEKLSEGTFLDPSLPVNTAVNARMVVIDKADNAYSKSKSNESNTDNGLGDVKIVPAVIVEKNVKAILAEEGAVQVNVSGGNVDVLKQIAERFGKKIVFFREVETDRLQNKGVGVSTGSTQSNTGTNEGSNRVPNEEGRNKEGITNGFVNTGRPNTIFLNVDSSNHLTYILGHELGHTIKLDDPKLWARMGKELQPLVRQWGKYKSSHAQSLANDAEYVEELFGDVIGDNFINPQFWEDMASINQSLFKSIANKVISLLNKAIRMFVGDDIAPYISDMKKARSIVASVMSEYAEGAAKGRYESIANGDGDTKRSRGTPKDDIGLAYPGMKPPKDDAPVKANPHSWDSPEKTKFDDWIYKLQDKHIDTKRVIDAIDKNIDDDLNVYEKEETYHNKAASRNKDFVNNELRPLIDSMREMDIDIPTLDEYLHARTAEETNILIAWRNRDTGILQDGGSGMKTADARKYLSSLAPAQRKNLEAIASKVDAILEGTRQMYVDYGLESKSTVDGWRDMFDHYVPLMREQDGETNSMGVGQGFSVKGKEVKGRTGSTRKVVDIFANIAMQREKVIVRGEKNKVAKSLLDLASANPNPEFWSVGKPETKRVYNPDTDSVVEQADPLFKSRENVIVAKVKDSKGNIEEKAVIFVESNPRALRMSQALKNLDTQQMNGFMGGMAIVTRYFSAINTQYNPIFGVVNLVRDFQGAMINLTSTPLSGKKAEVAKHTLSALKAIYLDERAGKKGGKNNSDMAKLWREFELEGGPTGYSQMFDNSEDRAKAIENELNPTKWMDSPLGKVFTANGMLKVPMAQAYKQAAGVFGVLTDYNTAMENSVRLAAYKVAKEQGMTNQKAASLAKNLTVNFNRKGQVAQQVGALYAFFNASMQGSARLSKTIFSIDNGDVKTIRLSSTGKKIVYGGVLLGIVQALMLSAAGLEEDEPPEFVRERSLIIPTGWTGLTDEKAYINIPMPLGLHVLPNLGRIPTEFALNGFKKPTEKVIGLMGLIAGAFNPTGGGVSLLQAISPTAIDPIAALSENKDWTGKPIAKESYNRALPGHALTRDTASFPSKMLSEWINYVSGGTEYKKGVLSPTPDQIDYLIGQAFGGVGREALKTQQSISATMKGEDLPIYKIPLAGRFYGNAESQSSQANRFYANVDLLNEHETEIKGMKADRKGLELARYMRENPEARMFEAANKVEREIQQLRKVKRDLLKADAEPARIKMIENQIKMKMTRFNESFKSVSKSLE